MAVVQKAYYIPDDLYTGVLTGIYKITDGVIRYAVGPNKGQIVKHLKEVSIPSPQESKNILQAGYEIVRKNKKAAIVTGAIIGVGTVGTIAYNKLKNREPKVLKDFRVALREYVEAIRKGTMNIEIIDSMTVALHSLRADKNYENFNIQLSAEEIGVLVGMIQEYTMELARDNNYEVEKEGNTTSDDAIISLERYLELQKSIFEKAS